ncbi:MAG: tetratricopeptide repeat protein, partial [Candidatus Saccharimonadales bacterium]
AATSAHIWANSYERTISDIFGVENEVAKEVASALKVKLAPSEVKRLTTIPTNNSRAHDLYLQAYALNDRTDEQDQVNAIALLEEAVKLDSHYAAAWALLADSELALGDVYLPPRKVIPKARRAALEAVSSDYNLAAGHSELGALEYYYDWDYSEARTQLEKAVDLDPGSADARLLLADFLAEHEGDYKSAEKELARARVIDPLDPWISYYESITALVAGQKAMALELARVTLTLDPHFYYDFDPLGHVYAAMGEYKQCESRYRDVAQYVQRAAISYEYAACAIKAGDLKKGHVILERMLSASEHSYVDNTYLAAVYTALGEKDRAFLMLKKALTDRSSYLSTITQNFWFDDLKSDGRFAELLASMKAIAVDESSSHNAKI